MFKTHQQAAKNDYNSPVVVSPQHNAPGRTIPRQPQYTITLISVVVRRKAAGACGRACTLCTHDVVQP
eukprot:3532291-Prymnesium_polylepis.1